MNGRVMADDDPRDFVDDLKRRKGLNTIATIGEGLVHIATCVSRNKTAINEARGEVHGVRSEVRILQNKIDGINDTLERFIKRHDQEYERLWKHIDGRRPAGAGNGGNGNGSGVTFIRLGLQVIGLGFLVLALLIAFASPQAADLLRLIFTSGSTS